MKVLVQYTAQLRSALGRSDEQVELPEKCSLAGLVSHLSARWDQPAKSHLVTESGQTRQSLLLVLNGLAISAADASKTPLHSGDVIVLMPPVAGG